MTPLMTAVRIATRGLAVLVLVVAFALVHANTASAQSAVFVSPPFDQNQVGTPHTLTAQVVGCGFFNPNCAGVLVNWQVFGGGLPAPSGGSSLTNGIGQSFFTFTNSVAPITNTIVARAGSAQGQATKQWVAGPPTQVTLAPPFDTNTVGTPHTVTATVRDRFGNPVPGQPVQFVVSGGGTPSPPTGTSVTNPGGQANFTFTNFTVVTNGISAVVPGCCSSNLVTKRWIAGPPRTLTLSPPADSNTVGTQHCVTATVRDQFGNPNSGIVVRFTVTGSVNTSGSATTNASGMATFCYIGPPLPGADAIHAYADFDGDNMQDPNLNEPFGDATKAWVLPVSTPGCEVRITNGGWIIAANDDRSSFGGNAQVDLDGNVTGNEEYQDHGPAQPMNLHGNVLVVICTSATEATVYGQATVDGAGSFFYRLNVEDNAEPGRDADKYWILVGNGYDSGNQTLQGGNVQIHQD
jgi:hypothetical protein